MSKAQALLAPIVRQASACTLCAEELPLGPRPVFRADHRARLLIIGQAPGTAVHASGIPWDDPSGKRLRQWLNITPEQFYDESQVAIVPMGFCYPGKGRSGDLPPMPRCAPQWHEPLLANMPAIELTLLIGQYAQQYYLGKSDKNLTERVRSWRDYGPAMLPLPHPSPRNTLWLKRNPWFEHDVVPELQRRVAHLLKL